MRSNGGNVFIGDEPWKLFPVWDPASKRSAGSSTGHIARETTALYEALGGFLPTGLVAVGENDSGDYLVLDPSSRPFVWRHEDNVLEAVVVDWERERPRSRRRSDRAEAVGRVQAGLTALGEGMTTTTVIAAPQTRIYVQFARIPDGFIGEAVGERNLTKLDVHHMGARMHSTLPGLGWVEPSDPAIDSGNWTQSWSTATWDPEGIARLVVRTFSDV